MRRPEIVHPLGHIKAPSGCKYEGEPNLSQRLCSAEKGPHPALNGAVSLSRRKKLRARGTGIYSKIVGSGILCVRTTSWESKAAGPERRLPCRVRRGESWDAPKRVPRTHSMSALSRRNVPSWGPQGMPCAGRRFRAPLWTRFAWAFRESTGPPFEILWAVGFGAPFESV